MLTAFNPFIVIPSKLLVKFPSNDKMLIKTLTTTPRNHTIPDFKNLASLSI